MPHYLIFHPERQGCNIQGKSFINGDISDFNGNIFVDEKLGKNPPSGANEDPYVFQLPWLYSFCHATQLRRFSSPGTNIGPGSILIFAEDLKSSGELLIDTVFLVENQYPWHTPGLCPPKQLLPKSASVHKHPHFRGGLKSLNNAGHHGVLTYTARSYIHAAQGKEVCGIKYSFLPLTESYLPVKINISSISLTGLSNSINKNMHGRYPLLLDDQSASHLIAIILNASSHRVVEINRIITTPKNTGASCWKSKKQTRANSSCGTC